MCGDPIAPMCPKNGAVFALFFKIDCPQNVCFRCGLMGHIASNCKTDISDSDVMRPAGGVGPVGPPQRGGGGKRMHCEVVPEEYATPGPPSPGPAASDVGPQPKKQHTDEKREE